MLELNWLDLDSFEARVDLFEGALSLSRTILRSRIRNLKIQDQKYSQHFSNMSTPSVSSGNLIFSSSFHRLLVSAKSEPGFCINNRLSPTE